MNDQVFDADAFMNQTIDAPMETGLAGVPEGEYVAMIGDFDSSAFKTIRTKNGDRPVLEIPFMINDDALEAKMGRKMSHRETYWLDFDDNGKLAVGPDKNTRLGSLRKALGQNVAGQPWSPSMLRNMGPLRIAIKTTTDKNDPEKKYTNITRYAPIS